MKKLTLSEYSDLLIQISDAIHPRTVDRIIEDNIDHIESSHDKDIICKLANKQKKRISKRMRQPIDFIIYNN